MANVRGNVVHVPAHASLVAIVMEHQRVPEVGKLDVDPTQVAVNLVFTMVGISAVSQSLKHG